LAIYDVSVKIQKGTSASFEMPTNLAEMGISRQFTVINNDNSGAFRVP
jgi:hypothetical protein